MVALNQVLEVRMARRRKVSIRKKHPSKGSQWLMPRMSCLVVAAAVHWNGTLRQISGPITECLWLFVLVVSFLGRE